MAKRMVDTWLWNDQKWRLEIENPYLRYLWLYLLTCPNSQAIGIFYIPIETMSQDTKLDESDIKRYLMALTDYGLMYYSMQTEEIIIYNFPKYNIYSWGKPIVDMLNKEISKIKDTELIKRMIVHLTTYTKKHPNDKRTETLIKVLDLLKTFVSEPKNAENNENSDLEAFDNETWEELLEKITAIKG